MSETAKVSADVAWRQRVTGHLEAIDSRTKRLARDEIPAWVINPPAWFMTMVKRIDKLEKSMSAAMHARTADDDAWTRLPRPKGRCPVSGWSRSTVMARIKSGAVRTKMVQGARYYAAKDISNLINA